MRKVRCFVILTFMLGMTAAQSSNECKTPDSKEGVCVDLYDCPTLISLIDKADTNATAKTFLQKSHCGFNKKKKPKVCCFLDHIIPNSYAPIVENHCTTPDSKEGVCVDIYECEMLLSLVNKVDKNVTDTTYIQKSFCGFDGNKKPQVCCSLDHKIPMSIRSNEPIGKNHCITPDSKDGFCVDIYDCPMLLNQVNKHYNNPAVKVFLNRSYCGLEANRMIKVCCSSTDELSPLLTAGELEIKRNNPDRIVGGQQALLGAWPWIVALGYTQRGVKGIEWNCGGTLITKRHVLTAAHCAYMKNLKLTVVRLGDLDLNHLKDDGAHPSDVPVKKIFMHAEYNTYRMISDIALVKLRYAATYTEHIKPIKLPNPNIDYVSKGFLFVAGWGNTGTKNSSITQSTVLMEVQVPFVPIKKCKQTYSKTGFLIDNRVICAGEGGKDSCMGDSGGPLMVLNNDQYILMGIVSYGPSVCGTEGYPGVYTNVAAYSEWIAENMML